MLIEGDAVLSNLRIGERLAFWLLFPVTVPQGLWLRRTAPRFGAAAGPTSGQVGAGKPLRLLAIGDSIIAGVGAETILQALPGQVATSLAEQMGREVRWFALGKIGADARKVLKTMVPEIPGESFDVIVVSVGVNDVTGLYRTHVWRKELGTLLDCLRKHSPEALIVMVDVPELSKFPIIPVPLNHALGIRARTFSAVAELETSARPRCLYARTRFDYKPEQFSPDGFHPSTESYREWGRALAQIIEPYMKD
jgi:lysophospholipase L1-like esterase